MNLKRINIKPTINKKNGQINFSIPKKKMSKLFLDKIYQKKPINFMLEDL